MVRWKFLILLITERRYVLIFYGFETLKFIDMIEKILKFIEDGINIKKTDEGYEVFTVKTQHFNVSHFRLAQKY